MDGKVNSFAFNTLFTYLPRVLNPAVCTAMFLSPFNYQGLGTTLVASNPCIKKEP